MKLATWNVNSIKARQERVVSWLEREQPDVLCLQELKVTDEQFPLGEIESIGYHASVLGQKTYNGVAIVSKITPDQVVRGLNDGVDDPMARFIEATVDEVRILCVYVPNGKEVGSDTYEYKLEWLRRLQNYVQRTADPTQPLILCGDMNVAPADIDVAVPEQWGNGVLCHSDARDALQGIIDWGLVDIVRKDHPDERLYSWWDYRMLGFPKGNGLRIDHILVTEPMVLHCEKTWIDRDERKGKKPSDHAPVVAEFS